MAEGGRRESVWGEARDTVAVELENAGLKLTEFFQLTNEHLKRRFDQELENLKLVKLTDGFDPNITRLYHGTTSDVDQICEEGLDERLSRKGRFGKGIYFSDNPIKCCKYSEKKKNNNAYLLVCKVILGDIKKFEPGEEDRKLIKEPVKEIVNGRKIFYDSVMGHPVHHTEYVIYEKRRVLIEYIAYYEKQESARMTRVHTASLLNSDQDTDSDASSLDSSDESDDDTGYNKALNQKVKETIHKERTAALKQLAHMKSYLKPSEFDELAKSYVTTYGRTPEFDKMKFSSKVSNDKGSTKNVSTELMKEFSQITKCDDMSLCKTYLENNDCILDAALNSYFDCNQ